ncbi:hypothetical protein Nepgr_033730 [Nepenthes gracilis]|uniref:Uncharacterized protein n=1 Tax=Nepenthes gracilis TaxID=150966 RepID=A0AAD3TME6_NEPGR|nr:hypothetical protein Nepgr_033730 [Nepenthes gracilis]
MASTVVRRLVLLFFGVMQVLCWDSVLMLLVRMIPFGSASLLPTAQSMDCGAVDSCMSLGIYYCINNRCELVWYTNCTAVAVVVVWLFWLVMCRCHESLAASLLFCRAGAVALFQIYVLMSDAAGL